jgi:hypothetical protein
MPTPTPPGEPIPLPPSPWVLADADVIEHTTVLLERLAHWLHNGPRTATGSCGHALSLGEDDFPDRVETWASALAARLRECAAGQAE